MEKEYSLMSKYYDLLHNKKNYEAECNYFSKIITKNKKTAGNTLLDLACGTGEHIKFFKQDFSCEGLDKSEDMLNFARIKNPEIDFYIGDMALFKLDKKYDIITILFNSIAYLDKQKLKKTCKNAYNHLNKGGVLLIEYAFIKGKFNVFKSERMFRSKDINIFREILIKHHKNDVVLKAKYKINSNNFIEEDEQKILLLDENYLKELLISENFKVKICHYKKNKSTLFVGIK